MKKINIFIFFILGIPSLLSAQSSFDVPLIPKPNKIIFLEGELNVNLPLQVYISDEFSPFEYLVDEIPKIKVFNIERIKKVRRSHNKGLRLLKAQDSDLLAEDAFKLTVDDSGIVLKAHNSQTLINGVMTLVQLMNFIPKNNIIQALEIEDRPRFSYRGLHLDVSKHYMPPNFIRKLIDVMAFYKFNYLHWHLTDGAGWRLEINRYPELTQIAAWRTHTHWKDWWENGRQYLNKGAPNASGGFYTQEEARELVLYALKKGITIIPEIGFPAHSEEVLAVYPELSCAEEPYIQGEFCIGNPKTFDFMKNVLDEVMQIFLSPYIHIGGDEADRSSWEHCDKCQALIKEKGMENISELQSYAIHQVNEYLVENGKKMIGWDEILKDSLSKEATVMSRRGEEGGVEAANKGYDVIMAPARYLYFDNYQADPRYEPEAIGGYSTLEDVYSYEPVSAEIAEDKQTHIQGAQGNLWTEYLPGPQQVEYMAFPRAMALAEINWTEEKYKDWEDFQSRLNAHYAVLQNWNVNYRRPSYNIRSEVIFDTVNKTNIVHLKSEQTHPDIRYTIDGSEPDGRSTKYNKPFELTKSTVIKAAIFTGSTRLGEVETVEVDIHKAIGKSVHYNNPYSDYPAQREQTLTNGIKGTLSYSDEQWQGFTGDVDVTLDMGRRERLNRVSMRFMQMPGPGIYFPQEFKVFFSDNGKDFKEMGSMRNDFENVAKKLSFKSFLVEMDKPQVARYIKVVATNAKGGYLFTDELVVY